MTPTMSQLTTRIERLERAIKRLQSRIDPDTILDAADRKALAAYRRDKKAGRLISDAELREKHGL